MNLKYNDERIDKVAKRLSLLQLLMSIINRMRKVSIITYQQDNTQPPNNHYLTIIYRYGVDR